MPTPPGPCQRRGRSAGRAPKNANARGQRQELGGQRSRNVRDQSKPPVAAAPHGVTLPRAQRRPGRPCLISQRRLPTPQWGCGTWGWPCPDPNAHRCQQLASSMWEVVAAAAQLHVAPVPPPTLSGLLCPSGHPRGFEGHTPVPAPWASLLPPNPPLADRIGRQARSLVYLSTCCAALSPKGRGAQVYLAPGMALPRSLHTQTAPRLGAGMGF